MCGSFDGVKADTFVSHWWGEEFPKFMRAWVCPWDILKFVVRVSEGSSLARNPKP